MNVDDVRTLKALPGVYEHGQERYLSISTEALPFDVDVEWGL
jgi:hypothetical protein